MFNRTRWSAFGAAVAITLAAGVALPSADATNTDGGGAGGVFVPIAPCRLFDTRAASTVGLRSAPLAANDTFTQKVTGTNGNCTIPAQATGVAMNVTIVNPTATSFLTVYPTDTAQPTASNLNWIANAGATPNKVDVKLSADGRINLFNNGGTVDVIADIVGYYTGHDHDDRYYTRDETDAKIEAVKDEADISILPPSGISFFLGGVPGVNDPVTIAGCVGNAGPTNEGRVPLVVPFGIEFMLVGVNVLDGSGTFPMRVSLLKRAVTDTGLVTTELDFETFPGDATNTLLRSTLDLPATEVVDGRAVYEVSITGLGSNHNAYCGGGLITGVENTTIPVT